MYLPHVIWDSGSKYERFMGRWSRRIASTFVADLETDAGLRWLDVGCGTGALTASILDLAEPASVDGVDASAAFIDEAANRLGDAANFHVASGDVLPFTNRMFDMVVSGLALNFMPDPTRALTEWIRVLEPSGRLAVYVWDYGGGMGFLRTFWDVVASIDSAGGPFEAERFAICEPGALAATFDAVGLREVDVGSIEIETAFTNFDDYWGPFLSGVGPAGAYVAGLNRDDRHELVTRLQEALVTSDDGSIELSARAWTATGSI